MPGRPDGVISRRVIAPSCGGLHPQISDLMKLKIRLKPRALPKRILTAFDACPPAGSGVHTWLFVTALKCTKFMEQAEIISRLTAAVQGCGRDVPHSEILASVVNAASKAGKGRSKTKGHAAPHPPIKKWPAVDSALQSKIIAESPCTVRQFRLSSPEEIDPDYHDAYYFTSTLFPGDPLLCVGWEVHRFSTGPIEQFQERLDRMTFIVPSPMSSKFGLTTGGERSQRTLTNTGPRRYLVTEFDSLTEDEQVSIILHLAKSAPLVMALWSGGKSIHAWWRCTDATEAQQEEFFRYAVRLGADPATWTACQLVRLPQGWRGDKRQRQEVYYFDPACLPTDMEGGAAR